MGAFGSLLAVAMFVSLIEVARQNKKHGTKIWIQPVITIINCLTWGVYAVLRQDLFLGLANGPGIVVASYTVYCAFRYAKKPETAAVPA
ncbi:MAG: SemiSWEET family transporter [Hyphomonadaceae bacterium]